MMKKYAQNGIIAAQDLYTLMQSDRAASLKILDASFVLPNTPVNPQEEFIKGHIPGAQFFDIKDFADHSTDLPHMLCNADEFSKKVGALGLSQNDFIVIYGQSGMIMGPARAWWSFKVFGHDNVAVLDGGLPAWKAANLPLENGAPTPPAPADYRAHLNQDRIKTLQQVQKTLGRAAILDARPAERYAGHSPEPRPGLRSGHIPGSVNLPCSLLVDSQTGCFKPKTELESLFSKAGYQGESVTLSCGSGVTACALALALHHLGHQNWSVYDGSWAEWGQETAGTPVECS